MTGYTYPGGRKNAEKKHFFAAGEPAQWSNTVMASIGSEQSVSLSSTEVDTIRSEVEQAAWDHLHAADAPTALGHYTDDAVAVTNTILFHSKAELAADVRTYYDSLNEVNLANWDELLVHVIDRDVAFVTGKLRFAFTDKSDERTDLQGIWTALFVRYDQAWKIRLRHESFTVVDDKASTTDVS